MWTDNAHINMHMHVTYVWKKYAQICGSLARIVRGGCYIPNMFKIFSNNFVIDNQRTKRINENINKKLVFSKYLAFFFYNQLCTLEKNLSVFLKVIYTLKLLFKSSVVHFSCTNLVSPTRWLGPWGTQLFLKLLGTLKSNSEHLYRVETQ